MVAVYLSMRRLDVAKSSSTPRVARTCSVRHPRATANSTAFDGRRLGYCFPVSLCGWKTVALWWGLRMSNFLDDSLLLVEQRNLLRRRRDQNPQAFYCSGVTTAPRARSWRISLAAAAESTAAGRQVNCEWFNTIVRCSSGGVHSFLHHWRCRYTMIRGRSDSELPRSIHRND